MINLFDNDYNTNEIISNLNGPILKLLTTVFIYHYPHLMVKKEI